MLYAWHVVLTLSLEGELNYALLALKPNLHLNICTKDIYFFNIKVQHILFDIKLHYCVDILQHVFIFSTIKVRSAMKHPAPQMTKSKAIMLIR